MFVTLYIILLIFVFDSVMIYIINFHYNLYQSLLGSHKHPEGRVQPRRGVPSLAPRALRGCKSLNSLGTPIYAYYT